MRHLKVVLMNLIVWLLERATYPWHNDDLSDVELHYGFPITVVYHNGEVEVLPLETDFKIDRYGVVYIKDRQYRRWVALPEIAELVFSTDRM